ncbi:hypothetical protein NBRC110019_26620 [Neptunitalea chrysea]|uniref:HTH cro/C1-type domain-containing protein n=1 Tax=Neptunitalea chrysea TaxID=1647581 RepID=A0A9W6B6V4_9FLAO|nr:LexA family transcriptional regulator [Neptunitalea chrysea]GLB53621.1 hypothetical protein NBRC110019_26620 [Neptunitalea chrysea]
MNCIASNIRHLRGLRGFSQEYFAEELQWTRSMVASFESGRTEPSVSRLVELSDYTKLPIDTLIKTDLQKSKEVSFIDIGNKRVLFPISVNDANEEMIEIVPIEASAGYLNGYDDPEYIEALQRFNLPFLTTGTYRAFPIKGDSMLPVKPGSFIIGKFVENITDLKNGKTYIILTKDDGLVYKRVYNHINDKGSLLLVSDNTAYEPYEVAVEKVLELWEFSCCIHTQEFDKDELKLSSISQIVSKLQLEIESLGKDS